ncbi:MAG: TonB-dependent receptor [Vicinamibacterales bacterium]
MHRAVLGFIAFLACAAPVRDAIALSIEIRGTVRDASGAAIDKAEVLLTTAGLTVVGTTRSNASGHFTISAPAPGSYLLIVRAPAFGETRLPVSVGAGPPAPLDVVLQIGALAEEVTVSATRESVDSLRLAAQPVSIVTPEEIAERVKTVVAQAVQAEAGVQLQQTSSTMAGIFVRGLTGNKVNVFVDGVRYSNGAQRGGVNTFLDLIEPDTLETIEVLRGPSSAQYGSDALGGSVQFFSKPPSLGIEGSPRWGGTVTASGGTAHRFGAGSGTLGYRGNSIGITATASARRTGTIRPGGGIDSHAAITRFFGLDSSVLMDGRLPNTGFEQFGGVLRANWAVNPASSVVATYQRSYQDGGQRYDQLLGGDGNFIADLNDLSLDLFSARFERLGLGPFAHATVTYSLNSQREERVNQGGNGNPAATIGHEPERTTVHGVHGVMTSQLSPRQTLSFGADVYSESLTSDAFNVNPTTNAISPRRPRVPDHASYLQGGLYAQTAFDAVPDRARLVGSIRYGGATYEARADDSPIVNGSLLWPDDSLGVSNVTFRMSAVITPDDRWTFLGSISRGFRAPHMTDLGTLGLTGSGFEVAAPDVAGLNGTVGTTADASAVSTGDPVEQVGPETSMQYEGAIRFGQSAFRTELSIFVNNVHDNIQKQALILPPGAVGQMLGGQPITSQNANGVVFVAATTVPVLVRDNFDNARIWGIEHTLNARFYRNLTLRTAYTYIRSRDTVTDLPPNIEGGTPAPQVWMSVRYAPEGRRWWVEPYGNIAAKQSHLSSLDLGDRRVGAGRSRSSIQAFFRNGARHRGWTSPGPDGVFDTADDTLIATGETLAEIQNRVLGPGVNSSSLFRELPGYAVFGIRGGLRLGKHELLVDLENLGDENYRGISWGVDAPGRGLSVRYVARF